MKSYTLVSFVILLLLPIEILSQTQERLKPEQLLLERFNSKSNPGELIKNWTHPDNFRNSETRTIINQKTLDNWFKLSKGLNQIRDVPDWFQEKILSKRFIQSQEYVIDTAIVLSTHDTVRHIYTFNDKAKMTCDLTQKLNGANWEDSLRVTNEYDEAGSQTPPE